MIIQKLCERLGGLRVYRELSRLLEASQSANNAAALFCMLMSGSVR